MYMFQEERYIARIYYESMRDNFEGYAWEPPCSGKQAQQASDTPSDHDAESCADNSSGKDEAKEEQLRELKRTFEALDPLNGGVPTLGQLFKIELALIWLVPDPALRARFWTIEDRFRRVVPSSVVASYERSLTPDKPEKEPVNQCQADSTLRQRARNLLDVIHANYLINLGRENTIKRMMTILVLASAVILVSAWLIIATSESYARAGIFGIIVAGMFGAMISIIQRLQKATSRDAMVEDGIFELIGLRVGWVSVMMSIGIGGVFALFLYALVIANMIDIVLPELAGDGAGNTGGTGVNAGTADTVPPAGGLPGVTEDALPPPASDPAASPQGAPPQGASPQPAAPSANPPAIDIPAPQTPPPPAAVASSVPVATDLGGTTAIAQDLLCCPPGVTNCMWVDKVAIAIGLASRAALFKMLATAFIAGFAERLVPDIINRLGKQDTAALKAVAGSNKPVT